MDRKLIRWSVITLAQASVFVCAPRPSQPKPARTLLAKIPMRFTRWGYIEVTVNLAGRPTRMIIDTGSPNVYFSSRDVTIGRPASPKRDSVVLEIGAYQRTVTVIREIPGGHDLDGAEGVLGTSAFEATSTQPGSQIVLDFGRMAVQIESGKGRNHIRTKVWCAEFHKGPGGHYYTPGTLDRKQFSFAVDTGSPFSVMLSPSAYSKWYHPPTMQSLASRLTVAKVQQQIPRPVAMDTGCTAVIGLQSLVNFTVTFDFACGELCLVPLSPKSRPRYNPQLVVAPTNNRREGR